MLNKNYLSKLMEFQRFDENIINSITLVCLKTLVDLGFEKAKNKNKINLEKTKNLKVLLDNLDGIENYYLCALISKDYGLTHEVEKYAIKSFYYYEYIFNEKACQTITNEFSNIIESNYKKKIN